MRYRHVGFHEREPAGVPCLYAVRDHRPGSAPGGSSAKRRRVRWALARHDPAGWLVGDSVALIETNDGPFKHHLDRAKYPEHYASDAAIERAACVNLLRALEDRLTASPYLCGAAFGLADAALLPFVRQFASIDRASFDIQPMPHVRGWLDRFTTSRLFDTAMVRLAPWKAGDPDLCFPASLDLNPN